MIAMLVCMNMLCLLNAFLPSHVPIKSCQFQPLFATRKHYSTPEGIEKTRNYRESAELSTLFTEKLRPTTPSGAKSVVIIGGGLSGLSCAKYLVDAGHKPIVYEARSVLGGKVSAWKDKDGDWIETGLHIFFGAYPNMMNLFSELKIKDRLQWKNHQMTFAMQNLPGQYTSFQFTPGIPAPFNMALAILTNTEMLSWTEKVLMVPALLPMLVQGQDFIDAQDELSVTEFMEKYGMPSRVNDEIFIAMGKALDFIDPEKLSMTVILTAMNRFINEADGSQTAFLDGNAPDRLCAPMVEYIKARGGEVHLNSPVAEIITDADTNGLSISGLRMKDGAVVKADEYISAMPVDVFKRIIPRTWSTHPYFTQLDELEGIPVINIQLWFDKKLNTIDGLTFSRSPLLSVYADMAVCCDEYGANDPDSNSMIELVFAPCTPNAFKDSTASNAINWMAQSNEDIVDATMGELARLFPTEIAVDDKWPSIIRNKPQGKQNEKEATLLKYSVVKTPRSVYAAYPGRNKFRPSQSTPVPRFTLAGDWTSQKFLGSMEGAVLAGKLAAEVVARKLAGLPAAEVEERPATAGVVRQSENMQPREPQGILPYAREDKSAIAYGGGVDLGV